MTRSTFFSKVLFALIALVVAFPLFWFAGGITWLDTRVFPPRRPKDMPKNAVWINAPALPISWHHGWWFGCEMASSQTSNYCRLVRNDGNEVYGGDYLPCRTSAAIPENEIHLVPPRDSAEMW